MTDEDIERIGEEIQTEVPPPQPINNAIPQQ